MQVEELKLVLQSFHENEKWKTQRRLEVGYGEPLFAQSPKNLYYKYYFVALYLALEAIGDRLKAAHGLEYV